MAAALLRIGDVLAMKGENNSALDYYRDALKFNAESTDANADGTGVMRNRATLYQHMGDIFVQQLRLQRTLHLTFTPASLTSNTSRTQGPKGLATPSR